MPPKQDQQAEKVSAMEGQIACLLGAIDGLRSVAERHDRQFVAMEKNADERHQQVMEMFKQLPARVASPEKVESKESHRETEGSVPKAQGLLIRPEKGLLQVPEEAIPLRSTDFNTPSYQAGSSGFSAHQKLDSPPKKLELPNFEGKNPDDWIFRMEKCFSVNQTDEGDKLSLAMSSMTGCAVTWLRMIQNREEPLDWRDLKAKLRRRFKPSGGATILSQMLRLRQTGTVSEYREMFEELSAEVPHVPNDVLEEIFLHGMKRTLREQVVRLRPVGMDEIVDMAKIIIDHNKYLILLSLSSILLPFLVTIR